MGRVAVVALALVLAVPGATAALTITDMLGRPVALAGPPARIVSLVPSATELIFALGGEGRLVGVTDYCDFPPAARQKPSVGGMLSPSMEMIAALRADLVIATDSGNRRETFVQLAQLGVPIYLVHARTIDEMMDVTVRLGELTGRQAAVAELRATMTRGIDAIRRMVAGRPRPRVLYVLWPEPLIVPGREALVTELIRLAGGDSITAGEASDYPRFSIEAAVARGPEVIVLARHGTGSGPIPREPWDRFGSLPAVKNGRLHSVNGDMLHRYGPRVVDGLAALARVIHPEAFR